MIIQQNGKGEEEMEKICKEGRVVRCIKEERIEYKRSLKRLQVDLLKFQNHVKEQNLKVLMIFEGRDTAGKGGTIKRLTEHLNPRGVRIVALNKPTEVERTQWYFQRYTAHLPSGGEIVFFDRSYYNRAGVEPVMGFCTKKEHEQFLEDVPKFERLLVKSDIMLFKYYLSISKEEQAKRLKARIEDPLKQYKISPVDMKAQLMWDEYTKAKISMFKASDIPEAPWTVIKSDNKKRARINVIKHILSRVEYPDKIDPKSLEFDKEIVLSTKQVIDSYEQ